MPWTYSNFCASPPSTNELQKVLALIHSTIAWSQEFVFLQMGLEWDCVENEMIY